MILFLRLVRIPHSAGRELSFFLYQKRTKSLWAKTFQMGWQVFFLQARWKAQGILCVLCISEHFHEAWGKKTPPDSGVGFDRKLYSKRALSVKRFDQ